MNSIELKAKYPAACAEIVAQAIEAERSRVAGILAVYEGRPQTALRHIMQPEDLSQTERALGTRAAGIHGVSLAEADANLKAFQAEVRRNLGLDAPEV
jgi:hypothetical protein